MDHCPDPIAGKDLNLLWHMVCQELASVAENCKVQGHDIPGVGHLQ